MNVLPSTTIGGRLVHSSGLAYVSPGAKLDQVIGAAGLRLFGLIDVQRGLTLGLTNRLSTTTPAQIIWGDQRPGGQQIIWGDHIFLGGQQIIWGDQILNPSDQQIIWGDHILNPGGQQIIWGDQIFNPSGQQIIWGDQTFSPSGQQIIWGDQDTSGGYQIIWGDSTPPEGGW